jgi:hypothetical protein
MELKKLIPKLAGYLSASLAKDNSFWLILAPLSKATVARSADLQSAESRVSNPLGGPQHPADWKSALPPKKDGKIY